jgi:low temperature requirement protein LtrA
VVTTRRRLIEPPRLRDLDEESRSATPLEAFFDLVFTAATGEIARLFSDHPNFSGLWRSIALFFRSFSRGPG